MAATLLKRERDRLSTSLSFAGAYQDNEALAQAIATIKERCPKLAETYDKYLSAAGSLEGADALEDDSSVVILGDHSHQRPLALHGLASSWLKQQRDDWLSTTDTRAQDERSDFTVAFRQALRDDYGLTAVRWETRKLMWAKKLSFTNP
ncbi:hypothetical protein MCOR11_008713 [Pyricularia oryzae]|nr:hypothetical protein MCOR11_008713 [Pyricularia oryzae]